MQPLVSVVIPLYQTERYIADAMRSVLAQTCEDFELIVVDDGSRDRGPEIAAGFADARVRLVGQANRGLAGARNTGIRLARGRYIALLDADDCWAPDKLARHVAVMQGNPAIGLSFSASRLIDGEGRPLGLVQSPSRPGCAAADIFCRNPVGNGSAPVIRRAALDAIAFHDAERDRLCWFDESFRQSEDIECWTRIAATTPWTFAYVDGALTDYRVTLGGLSANTSAQLATWRRFRAKVAGYAPGLEAEYGDLAEAYQLRYLARRAVRGGTGDASVLAMIARALWLAPRIVVEEPARTFVTMGGALARKMLPAAACDALVDAAMGQAARMPALRV